MDLSFSQIAGLQRIRRELKSYPLWILFLQSLTAVVSISVMAHYLSHPLSRGWTIVLLDGDLFKASLGV